MGTINAYADIIKRILGEYAALKPSRGEVEVEVVCDDKLGHYELVYSGWDDWRRVHGSVIHIDIRDDKIWIQFDGTEGGVANDLIEAGVPPEDIVLAFHHPHKRPYTGFAVG